MKGNPAIKGFIAAIFLMGCIRFALTVSDFPNATVKYFSMTAIMVLATLYFAVTTESHLDRLKAAYFIVLPYMIVEVAALGYTWASGRQTIFHANEYTMGFSLPVHTVGHLVGGLTWEPLITFLFMEVIWVIVLGVRKLAGL